MTTIKSHRCLKVLKTVTTKTQKWTRLKGESKICSFFLTNKISCVSVRMIAGTPQKQKKRPQKKSSRDSKRDVGAAAPEMNKRHGKRKRDEVKSNYECCRPSSFLTLLWRDRLRQRPAHTTGSNSSVPSLDVCRHQLGSSWAPFACQQHQSSLPFSSSSLLFRLP